MNPRAYLPIGFFFSVLMMASCAAEKENPSGSQNYDDIEIIAHRGDSYYAPENTMAAVNSAWEKNADAVEVDVYLSADNRVVAIHDKTTGRTGDVDLQVKASTSQELLKVDVGSFKGEEFKGERIPFLEDIMASIPAGKKLFIEIKDTDQVVPYIKEIVEDSGKKDQVVIIAFNLNTAAASKEAMPAIPVYWLHSAPRGAAGNARPIPLDIIATAKEHNLDGVDVNHRGITKEFVEECRKLGQKVYVWTVNDLSDIRSMADLGVDGITTDRIDNAQEVLGR